MSGGMDGKVHRVALGGNDRSYSEEKRPWSNVLQTLYTLRLFRYFMRKIARKVVDIFPGYRPPAGICHSCSARGSAIAEGLQKRWHFLQKP